MMAPILLLPVVLIAAFAIWKLTVSGRLRSAATPRHRVVRVLGAVWLVGTLAAVGWFTWRDHSPASPDGPLVLVTTTPPAPIAGGQPYQSVELSPCRIILTLLVLDGTTRQPVWGASEVCRWPDDRNRDFLIDAGQAGISCQTRFRISGFRRAGEGEGLHVDGSMEMRGDSWSRGGGMDGAMERIVVENLGTRRATARHPLSIVPRHDGRLVVAYCFSRAAAGDPLKSVPLETWFKGFPPDQVGAAVRHLDGPRLDPANPPGAEMLRKLGPASVLLLFAAIAGAQCFLRRGTAFAGLLAGMVLFAGTADYLIMRRHAARALDASLSPALRQAACDQAGQTFFHQAAATRLLSTTRAVLAQPTAERPDRP